MALTEAEVRGIAEYARIALSDEELLEMTAYMNDAVGILEPILQYMDEDVSPTFHPIGELSNVMRADEPDDARALSIDDALKDAASVRERSFRVPSILGEGGDR
ncbi:MAG: Asp-tRNA(Asn)/Glu-tRNA(Gln) amidotransferase subunit GatC [Collinsella sp.]|nr:Asp-tRNA(Asn)/Glu-tRNA(Gln) amidotransferase subunit GatC [Collinsella sp.]